MPLVDVFGRLHNGGGALSNVLKRGGSLLHLARSRLSVVESGDGRSHPPSVPQLYFGT